MLFCKLDGRALITQLGVLVGAALRVLRGMQFGVLVDAALRLVSLRAPWIGGWPGGSNSLGARSKFDNAC